MKKFIPYNISIDKPIKMLVYSWWKIHFELLLCDQSTPEYIILKDKLKSLLNIKILFGTFLIQPDYFNYIRGNYPRNEDLFFYHKGKTDEEVSFLPKNAGPFEIRIEFNLNDLSQSEIFAAKQLLWNLYIYIEDITVG